MNRSPEPLQIQLFISTPLRTEVLARTKYGGCEILVGGVKTKVDLIKLWELKFDIVLGMNWLSTFRASVDCYKKKGTLRMDEIPKFTIEGIQDTSGTPIISTIKATRWLRYGCQGFIAIVLRKDEIETKIENILVVKEYPEYFLKTYRAYLQREVEFTNNVLPGLHLYLRLYTRWPKKKWKNLKYNYKSY